MNESNQATATEQSAPEVTERIKNLAIDTLGELVKFADQTATFVMRDFPTDEIVQKSYTMSAMQCYSQAMKMLALNVPHQTELERFRQIAQQHPEFLLCTMMLASLGFASLIRDNDEAKRVAAERIAEQIATNRNVLDLTAILDELLQEGGDDVRSA